MTRRFSRFCFRRRLRIDIHNASTPYVVRTPLTGALPDGATYCKYCAYVETNMVIIGMVNHNHKSVVCEIGRRTDSFIKALLPSPDSVPRFDASFDAEHVIADTMTGLAKMYSNFSSISDKINLAGVVEQLAKGLACSETYDPGSTAESLAGGADIKISALSMLFTPVNAHLGKVLIPRMIDTVVHPDVFSVLACAMAGEEGEMVSDHLEIDASTRDALFTNVAEGRLAPAIVDAPRILGSTFAVCDQGDLFAYAMVRGLSSVNSLVAHTRGRGNARHPTMQRFCRTFRECISYSHRVRGPSGSVANRTSVAASILLRAGALGALVAHC